MAKFLLVALALLAQVSSVRAENLLELLKGKCDANDIKQKLDVTPPQDLDHLADADGQTGLFFCRHLGTALMLLAGADPNVRDHTGRTPAFRAVTNTQDPAFPAMLELLALRHADLNARDKDGISLLAYAAHENNLPAVRLLLLLGADPVPEDVPADKTPVAFAREQENGAMVELLRRAAAGSLDKPQGGDAGQRLASAATAGQLEAISAALAAGADINARDADGATALLRAVSDRRADVAALLLLKGANPSLAKNDGRTPLMQCVEHFDMLSERMMVELILAGADLNMTAKDGNTALTVAVEACNNTAAQWLIWRKANLDVHGPLGTPMQTAAAHPDWPSMIEILRRAGLPDQEPLAAKDKSFILFNAVRAGNLPAVEAELDKGTPVDVANQYDQTALEWAICYDQTTIVDELIRRGASINHQHSYNGENLIHMFAATKGANTAESAKKIQKMIDWGANPNLLMLNGCTPLMVAAREGSTGPNLELLLKVTTNLNVRDKQGLTALGLARQHGNAEIVKALQEKGAVE